MQPFVIDLCYKQEGVTFLQSFSTDPSAGRMSSVNQVQGNRLPWSQVSCLPRLPCLPWKIRTYHLAKEFYKDCEVILCKPHIRTQLSRASLSVVNNLAEGSAKPSPKDQARLYAIALGSFRECQNMLDLMDQTEMLKKYDFLGICLFKLHRNTLNSRSQAPWAWTPETCPLWELIF